MSYKWYYLGQIRPLSTTEKLLVAPRGAPGALRFGGRNCRDPPSIASASCMSVASLGPK